MRQLQGMDASFVALETKNSPMHIGSLLIYNPATAPGGFVRFKDILSFYESRLQLSKTVREGDSIRLYCPVGDITAQVREISLGFTILVDQDDNEVVVPNSVMMNSAIVRVVHPPRSANG